MSPTERDQPAPGGLRLWGTTSAIVPSPVLMKRRIPANPVGWNSPRWRRLVRAAQVSGRFGAVVLVGGTHA